MGEAYFTEVKKMGLMASTDLIATLGLGTLIGATSTYFLMKFRPNTPNKEVDVWQNGMEEQFEFADPKDEYRLILAVRNDLKMQKGKVAAQCSHAAVAAYAKAQKSRPKTLKNWLRYGGTKIAVRIESEAELLRLDKKAKEIDVISSIVRDAGQTQVAPGTRTVIAIGPAPKSVLDQITGHLKLY